jgi:hypothetical protein
MVDFFLHPWAAALGAALISVPIIIHLINRMRFRRVRWAAMEFLLKSQKRNRRRLLIEQLILLALRCSLVVLAGVLVSRFVGCSPDASAAANTSTTHVVVLDDTLSMTDRWKEQGETKSAFSVAKAQIQEIAKQAARAGGAHQLKVIRLTEPAPPVFDARLNDETLVELAGKLDAVECSPLHVEPRAGVEAAAKVFDETPQDRRVLHFVSDFRARDWGGTEGEAVGKAIDALAAAGVKIYLVDAAHPYRKADRSGQVPQYHDNLAVTDLRPQSRVVARDLPVPFTVTIANFSSVERKVMLTVKVDGAERLEAAVPIDHLKPGYNTHTFSLHFSDVGFRNVSASLPDEEAGVPGDNLRYAVVDVLDQVPVLLVDGDGPDGLRSGGSTFYLLSVLESVKGVKLVPRGIDALEKGGLDQYACIYLLNVGPLKPPAVKALYDYVREGGNVAFFLGDKVRPDFYNKELYKAGKGLFPVPLADKPTAPLTDAEKEDRKNDGQLKVLIRNEQHPIFKPILADPDPRTPAVFNFLLRMPVIDQYFPVSRLRWDFDKDRMEEVVTLPNRGSLDDYKGTTQELLAALAPLADNPKFAPYKPGLEEHGRQVRDSLGGKYLYELANALDSLLTDQGDEKDPKKPNLEKFWRLPEVKDLQARFDRLRETVRYGDPLLVTGRYGKGRVLAFMTTAGTKWTDWPAGSQGSESYVMFMPKLHEFLMSSSELPSPLIGSALTLQLDPERYQQKMHRYFWTETDAKGQGAKGGLVDQGEQQGVLEKGLLTFTFNDALKPGVYRFDFTPQTEGAAVPHADRRAFAFNVDAAVEGDLQRASRDDLERGGGKVQLTSPDAPAVVEQKRPDWSESPWFYLVLLLVLVAEQAMAVHLSFHLRENEAALPAAARPQQPQTAAAA